MPLSSKGVALRADHLIIDGSLFIDGDAKVNGKVNLHGAEIGCALNINGGEYNASESPAINADKITVGGDIIANKCNVTGGFRLSDSKVGGSVLFRGAQLNSSSAYALNADRAQVAGSFIITEDFTAKGTIRLADAAIGTTLEFHDSQFSCPDTPCLVASGARVQGDVVGDRVKVDGLLDLAALNTSGDVRIADAEISGIRAREFSLGSPIDQRRGGAWRGVAVRMTGATVTDDLDLRGTTLKQTLVLRAVNVSKSIRFDWCIS